MIRWEVNKTFQFVKAAFGAPQELLFRECLKSLLNCRSFSGYHYSEVIRLTNNYGQKYPEIDPLLEIYLLNDGTKRMAFETFLVQAGAHATAAVQSMHNLPEMFAHVIYLASGQNFRPEPLEVEEITIDSVSRRLMKDARFNTLSPLLAAVQSGATWNHLVALSSLSKHRTITCTAVREDASDASKKVRELQFSACDYQGSSYPQVPLKALWSPENTRLSIEFVALGRELNACFQRDSA